jgi:predicted O-linked N-acetylglucosamine transferase (SPINDLY family)
VILDTMHFNGMNTSLESLACGAVVVTLPTPLQRGRHTQAMYRRMELDQCIATDQDDYVARAVALGNERERREVLRREILERNHVLFEDRAVTAEFARAFEWMVAQPPAPL